MKKELVVVQKNKFIRGDFSFLGVRDIKILKLLVSKVNSTSEEFYDYYFITKEEVRTFHFNERNIHSYIKTSLRKLSSVFVVVKNSDDEEIEVSLVGKIIYDKKRGTYKVPLSSDLKEYLLDIKKEFTKYKLENLINLKRKEEIKLYEYFKSISFEVFTISIVNLKEIMELKKKSFDSFFNFHKKLKETITSINNHTDIQIEFNIMKIDNQSKNIQFFIKRFNSKTLSLLTIEAILSKYSNKTILLKGDEFIIKDIQRDKKFIILVAFSEELNIQGNLKFNTLEDCDKYLNNQIK
ncbi:replication initiation protein [Arcobacter peruensis]|uniref:replication initiation protein n=1 Tax=Arcobacter peruensis TaxID=2320140 RepID=UPI000F096424|nr:replication initiation protein [Arcobacter peruensis]